MGTLVAMRYRLAITANLADHTYVVCGNGAKAWGCWGGDAGGSPLRAGTGSTRRADAIAGPQARAGIRCYLVNGVCHQAANRVLLPAGITVRGARGYDLSEALFGTYGRPHPLAGLCRAPFHEHADVSGDLAPGAVRPAAVRELAPRPSSAALADARRTRRRERRYLAAVRALYARGAGAAARPESARRPDGAEEFQVELFRLKAAFQLPSASARSMSLLERIRRDTERARLAIEAAFLRGEMSPRAFARAFNRIAAAFQDSAAGVLGPRDYRALLGQGRGDVVRLADPAAVERACAEMER